MLQVPSLLTMHAPLGLSGVQAFMKRGHSRGDILPIITRWQLHPGWMSRPGPTSMSWIFLASFLENSSLRLSVESGITPIPLHAPSTTSKTSPTIF